MRAGITISVWESMPKYVIVVSDRKETKCMCENAVSYTHLTLPTTPYV